MGEAIFGPPDPSGIKKKDFSPALLSSLIKESVATREWIVDGIFQSREKDYTNPFRQMVFENEAEMQNVVGKLDDNSFISMKREELDNIRKDAAKLLRQVKA